MGIRKGYPFSRRQYKQGWGILSNTIFGLLGFGVYAAKGIKYAVESNTVSVNNDRGKSINPNTKPNSNIPHKPNNNANDKGIISDTIIDGNLRCLSVGNYIISGYCKSNYIYARLSCCKDGNNIPYYYINIKFAQRDYVYVSKGELMLIKLDNGNVLEFKNILEKKSIGKPITLSYFISEEQIKIVSERKITKIRISIGNKYKDIDVSSSDLSMYISKSYSKVKDRLQKGANPIYDNF